tara:strand:+ start:27 stop:233 length:207 start_codon:yes stop_codon:yes gene_type:complete
MPEYRTSEGDMIDWICWKHYGRQAEAVEAVLEANPGLADHGEILPSNIIITLPDIELPESEEIIRLWD